MRNRSWLGSAWPDRPVHFWLVVRLLAPPTGLLALLLATCSTGCTDPVNGEREVLRLNLVVHANFMCLIKPLTEQLHINASTLRHRQILHEADGSLFIASQIASHLREHLVEIIVSFDARLTVATLLERQLQEDELLEEVNESLLPRGLTAVHMVNGTLAPNIEHFLHILRDQVANDSGADVALLEKHVSHGLDSSVTLLFAPLRIGE